MRAPQYDFHCRLVWLDRIRKCETFPLTRRFVPLETSHAETAGVANPLRFRQISFAALQGLFRALTLEYFALSALC